MKSHILDLGKSALTSASLLSSLMLSSSMLSSGAFAQGPAATPPAQTANRSPAGIPGAAPSGNSTKEIDKEFKVTGQSRSLSMGLLFQKNKDKLSFGSPRTNYKDKVSQKSTNF